MVELWQIIRRGVEISQSNWRNRHDLTKFKVTKPDTVTSREMIYLQVYFEN